MEVLDLNKLLLEDPQTIEQMRAYAERMGWMYVKMHKELVDMTQQSIKGIKEFFHYDKNVKVSLKATHVTVLE